jgi:hypothetical protein
LSIKLGRMPRSSPALGVSEGEESFEKGATEPMAEEMPEETIANTKPTEAWYDERTEEYQAVNTNLEDHV